MTNLYITSDAIGGWSGGSQVTFQESEALRTLGPLEIVTASQELPAGQDFPDPFAQDREILEKVKAICACTPVRLAHCYSGTLTETIAYLKSQGVKVFFTCAAHNIATSRAEHYKLGIDYDSLFPHLVDAEQWARYARGYLQADLVIVPSTYSLRTVYDQGVDNAVVIPHGVHWPDAQRPRNPLHLPDELQLPADPFVVGYLGAFGADKGILYLLHAWRQLDYADAVLVLAGRHSNIPWVQELVRQQGGGNTLLAGWVEQAADFYDTLDLYVQPSASEGFGLEVLEAMAHGKLALCSEGAGAADVVPPPWRVPACDAAALAKKIDHFKRGRAYLPLLGEVSRRLAQEYRWENIRERYLKIWREWS